jgi:selT/selW/selH-like putative selenoprotein
MLKENGIAASATPGRSGQFDVLRDGELVFSKAEAHRFPGEREILAAVE